MTTATEIRAMGEERDSNRLDMAIRDFIKRYEPEERRDRLDFEMALHHLVRQIYQEASKPYEKIMSAAVQGMSLQPFLQTVAQPVAKEE